MQPASSLRRKPSWAGGPEEHVKGTLNFWIHTFLLFSLADSVTAVNLNLQTKHSLIFLYVFVYSFTLFFSDLWNLRGLRQCGKEPPCQFRRHKTSAFDPRVRKIPWRRAWQPTPVFLPGQRILAGYSPWGHKESDLTEATKLAYMWNLSSPSRDGPLWKHRVLTTGPPGETFPVKCCFLYASHAGVCQEILFGEKKKKEVCKLQDTP